MKIHKALKVKNLLISEINELKDKIKKHNSYLIENTENAVNTLSLLDELSKKINKLITLKTMLNTANSNIQHLIYEKDEIKNLILFYKTIDTTVGFAEPTYTQTEKLQYDSFLKESQVENLIKELQNKFNAIQDEIDEYNHTIEIAWND